ncbi:prolyl oligopeptidase family serine peptidase [Maribacter sp. CXY002]|uniref:prolyl oligopeptidase family serine peptidase n=1 Tax=Maribacter luteocoastalis TaxID=3407671 RepID=UPI003B67DB28
MKKLFLLLIISINAMAQSPRQDYASMGIESSKSWIDIDYVGDGIIGHKLDIFLPKTSQAPYPVAITIYGSAFFSNSSKANCFKDNFGQTLLQNGFAVVSINHRSSKDALWPAQIHDVKAAIRFIRGNAKTFSLDEKFIGITGFSSGGHLSAMAGVTSHIKNTEIKGLTIDLEGTLGNFTDESSHVDAVVDFFGPTDFLTMDSCGSSMVHDDPKSPESSLIGGPIQKNKKKTALANPMNYVNKDNPPFLILHGNKDPLVPHCQSEALYKVLHNTKVPSNLIIVDGGGHGPGVMIDTYYTQMINFFKAEMNKQ